MAYSYFSIHFETDCTRRKTRRADHATQHLLMFKIFETNRSPTQNPNIPKRILEIGTGSGYQAVVLSQFAQKVFTIERIKTL